MNALKRLLRSKFALIGTSSAWLALIAVALAAEPPATDEEPEHPSDKDEFLDRTVELPRYVVSAIRIDKNPWRYGSVPGFEVLTRASKYDTNWVLEALQRGRRLEDQVLPPDWLPPSPIPYTVIIDDTDLETVQPANSLPMKFAAPDDALTWGSFSRTIKVVVGRSGVGDHDTFAFNRNVHDVRTTNPALGTISLERLARCTPPLPLWLTAGLLGGKCGVFRESFALVNDEGEFRRIVGPGMLWISLDETRRLLKQINEDRWKQRETLVRIPPLDTLFVEKPPSGERLPLWESEAALFVRWGLMGPGRSDPATSSAFLRFVQRARGEPVTERMFTDCFGFGYATMKTKLSRFLVEALPQENFVTLDAPTNFPDAHLKPATADQIGRILGDWLRMQGRSVRGSDPAMSAKLLDAAGRMLRRAYQMDNGLPPDADSAPQTGRMTQPTPSIAQERVVVLKPFVVAAARIHDPDLLATFGLYEHDAGRDVQAREFLEKAAKTGAARPNAYVVLAQLRYAEAIAKPAGSGGKLSEQQAAFVLSPLRVALHSSSASGTYELLVETWAHCEAMPSDPDMGKITDGVSQFPRNAVLAFKSARLCAHTGDATRATELIDKGLVFVTDERTKAEFERLRSQLAAAGNVR